MEQIGIVGLGTMGRIYARFASDLGLSVLGADVRDQMRDEFASEFGADTYREIDDLYAEDIDAVIVATPNAFHETAVRPAIEEGLHVFLEKPIAHTVEAAERIVAAARETDVVAMVGYYHRYANVSRCLKQYIDRGRLGEITRIEATFALRRGIPHRGSWYTSKEIAGGGALMDKGTFVLDTVAYLLGAPPIRSVTASTAAGFGDRDEYIYLNRLGTADHPFDEEPETDIFDVEDAVTTQLEVGSGITVAMHVAWAENQPSRHEYRVDGREAGAHLNLTSPDEAAVTIYESGAEGTNHFVDRSIECPNNDPQRDQLREFVRRVRDGDTGVTDLADGLYVQRAVERIYEDADGNEP